MEEKIAEQFYKKILEADRPAYTLYVFYCQIFDLNAEDLPKKRNIISMFGKFVKLYGREICYNSLLDMAGFENINLDNIFALYSYLCKKRFAEKMETRQRDGIDLSKFVEDARNKKQELKISDQLLENPFDEQ